MKRWTALGVAVFLLVGAVGSSAAWAGPDDIVPRGHIAYDLLGSLAAAGQLPGYTLRDFARGDRLYTRAEIAALLLKRAQVTTTDNGDSDAAERLLRMIFAPELKKLGVEDQPNSALPARNGVLTGQIKLRAVTNPGMGEGIVRAAATVPVGRDGALAISGGNFRREWYSGSYPLSETAFLRINGRVLDVTIGQSPLRWGPGFTGGMLFSDEAPAVPRIEVEKGFSLPGVLGRRVGPLHYNQFYGQFFTADVPGAPRNATGTRRHLAGRRLETAGTGRFTFSLAEGIVSTRLPDPLLANVLPFYIYQNDWTRGSRHRTFGFLATSTEPDTFWLNYMADIGLAYRVDRRGTRLYADVVLDDLKAPSGLGRGDDTPRKIGQLYGIYLPDLGGVGRYGARFEYATVDANTFTHSTPANAWVDDGRPLGYSSGPNARVYFTRLDWKASDTISLAFEGQSRRRRTTIPDRPDPNINRVSLFATYAPRRDAYAGIRAEYRTLDLPGRATDRDVRFEVNAGAGF